MSNQYSDELRKLIGKKSSILLYADAYMSSGRQEEAKLLLIEAAMKEEQIAEMLEANGRHEDAIVNLFSAASCYMRAERYGKAKDLLDEALAKPLTEAWRREILNLKEECLYGSLTLLR